MAEEVKKEETKTETSKSASGTGLEPNVAAMLAYLFDILGGLIFLLIEKDNKFVKFAGAQSLSLGVANLIVVWVILPLISVATLGFGFGLYGLYGIAYVALRIYLCVMAYQNKEMELPVIGQISRSLVK